MIKNLKKKYSELETLDYSALGNIDDLTRVVGTPKIVTENVEGRIVQKVVFEETPVEKMNSGLTVDDFALENLLANGYQPKRVDYTGNSLKQIDGAVASVENLKNVTNSIKSKKS